MISFARQALALSESVPIEISPLEGRGSDRTFFRLRWNQKDSAILIHYDPKRVENTFYADENDIEQLKNGVRALQAPSDNLLSNWAYMVIASLAWDLKAWYGMLLPYRHIGLQIIHMEFKRFINTFIRIPCLIIKTGRRICYRLVGYNAKLKHTLDFSQMLKSFSFQ